MTTHALPPKHDAEKLLEGTTPGPWTTCEAIPKGPAVCAQGDPTLVAKMAFTISHLPRAEANARLIAAAHDLAAQVAALTAENERLRDALRNLDRQIEEYDFLEEGPPMRSTIRAALAKGGQP